jgi:hypothetical protein
MVLNPSYLDITGLDRRFEKKIDDPQQSASLRPHGTFQPTALTWIFATLPRIKFVIIKK